MSFFSSLSSSTSPIYGPITAFILSRQQIIQRIISHLQSYSISYHGVHYQQICGIPQGSILSVPLCNLYLRSYEQHVLIPSLVRICDIRNTQRRRVNQEAKRQKGEYYIHIVRFVDDFLFICRDRLVYLDLLHFLQLQQSSLSSLPSLSSSLLSSSPLPSLSSSSSSFMITAGAFSKTILQLSSSSNPHIARWCGFLVRSTSVQLDSGRYVFHHSHNNHHIDHNRQPRDHFYSQARYARDDVYSIHSIRGIVQSTLKPRLAVLRTLHSFPSISEDLFLCVREALQRVQKKGKWIVRKENKMRLILRWIIHYLKHHIAGVKECKIRWIVYFAFLVLWRRNYQFRKVSEDLVLALLFIVISFVVLYCHHRPAL